MGQSRKTSEVGLAAEQTVMPFTEHRNVVGARDVGHAGE